MELTPQEKISLIVATYQDARYNRCNVYELANEMRRAFDKLMQEYPFSLYRCHVIQENLPGKVTLTVSKPSPAYFFITLIEPVNKESKDECIRSRVYVWLQRIFRRLANGITRRV